jgi:AhpD family alkylhydroperoxidase
MLTFVHLETALGTYLALQNAKSSIKGKAREVINLVVSQVNGCDYCQAAHTMLGKMDGFDDVQILKMRRGHTNFDLKLHVLTWFTKSVIEQRGHVVPATVEDFLDAGWTKENLIDTLIVIGDKTISDYLGNPPAN